MRYFYVEDPCKTRGRLLYKHHRNSIGDASDSYFVNISLRCHHAQKLWDDASSNKIKYVYKLLDILNLKGHQICVIGSTVTTEWVEFAYWWSFIGKDLACSLCSRLFFKSKTQIYIYFIYTTRKSQNYISVIVVIFSLNSFSYIR